MAVARLVIQIKKKTDGSAALSCRRGDGSVTWQRQDGQQGRFFPLHDLTHYAVETVLHHPRGFYGLVAEGWDLGDFGKPWPRGPMTVEALASELWPDVLSAVVAVPDPRRGERLILLTQQKGAARAEFQSFAKAKHASDLMIPSEVWVFDKLPVLGTGKVDMMALGKLVEERLAAKPDTMARASA